MGVPLLGSWVNTTYKRHCNDKLLHQNNRFVVFKNFRNANTLFTETKITNYHISDVKRSRFFNKDIYRQLFIDLNSIIHDVARKVIHKASGKKECEINEMIFNELIAYIEFFINDFNGLELLYLAVDGIPPFAKITQQRVRRYDSYYSRDGEVIWNSAVNISPGTSFMIELDKRLEEYIKTIKKVRVIYSSFNHYGEGEHKIMQYIKSHPSTDVMFYSNDGDTLLLSMIACLNNNSRIALYRETVDKGKIITSIFDVNKMCEWFYFVFQRVNESMFKLKLDKKQMLNDFILLSLFVGNDFLHAIPFFSSYEFELIIKAYLRCLEKDNMFHIIEYSSCYSINNKYFIDIIESLADNEFGFYYAHINGSYLIPNEIKIDDRIAFPSKILDYKYDYYDNYLHSNNIMKINELIINYLEGIKWIFDYYFNAKMINDYDAYCNNCVWYYKYSASPFISCIFNFMKENEVDINTLSINKDKDEHKLNCKELLFYIIHIEDLKIIDNELANKLKKYDFICPKNAKYDCIHKSAQYLQVPILPKVDVDTIKLMINE